MSSTKKVASKANAFNFQKIFSKKRSEIEIRNPGSARASPPTGSSLSSFHHDSVDLLDEIQPQTAHNRRTALNLQIPKRGLQTPSPKHIPTPKTKDLVRVYSGSAHHPIKLKRKLSLKETLKSKQLSELPAVIKQKFELEAKVTDLKLELQNAVSEQKKMKERRSLIFKLQETLSKLLEENERLKTQVRKNSNDTPEEPKSSMAVGDNIGQSMEEFKNKLIKLLGNQPEEKAKKLY
ncbi:unnamed protein product [Blepharisma stoltei]|uniref:Uncharacterized protein n=1 Tax=Blepharisma stoltei TaxID=1481888 RepID=A0AAU9JPV3_9CILI|nr:unnamed protein product [Blepharisma stoltei]